MPANFPDSPTVNQTYTYGTTTWRYTGQFWQVTDQTTVATLSAVTSNIVPASNIVYDLGSTTLRWRDLYLSGNTIDLGGTAIKSSAAGISFSNSANAQQTVALTVSSLQIASATGNVVTLQATATGLQTVGTTGNVVATTPGGSSGHVQYNFDGAFAGSSNLTFSGTTLTMAANPVLSAGTANGIVYLNAGKAATTGSVLTFDGTALGIGTTSPIGRFTVSNSGANGFEVKVDQSTGTETRLNSYNRSSNAYTPIGVDAGEHYWLTGNTERMRLTTTGLGIGTSSPVAKLQVSNAGAEGLEVAPTTGIVRLTAYNRSGGAYTSLALIGTSGITQTIGSTGIDFNSQMLLNTSGNLGLGVTPSAWAAGWKVLQLNARASIACTNSAYIISNSYNDGSNNRYIATGAAAMYEVGSDGAFYWNRAASGTAGNAITFTQAMTLDASGRLLVGTTAHTVSSSEKFEVYNGMTLLDFSSDSVASLYIKNRSTTSATIQPYIVFSDSSGNRAGMGVKTSDASFHQFGQGGFNWYSGSSGYSGQIMALSSTGLVAQQGAVFNESGADSDFRVESVGNANMLFVDASASTVYIGGTSAGSNVVYIDAGRIILDKSTDWNIESGGSANGNHIRFRHSSTDVGSIQTTTSGTTYNTTSDRRLKDNITTIADGTAKVMAMNPVKHTWKTDSTVPATHGFIAQEMMDICPEAVTGTPDGEQMMSMDYGRITPILVAALQDAHKKISELEARLNAMEVQ